MKTFLSIPLVGLLLSSCNILGAGEQNELVGRWGQAEIVDQETQKQMALPVIFDFSSNGKLTISSSNEAGQKTASYEAMKDAVRVSWDEWRSEDTMAIHVITDDELQLFSDDKRSLMKFKRIK